MDPATLGLFATSASTTLGAASAYTSGQQEAKLAKYNAKALNYAAQSAIEAGAMEASAAYRQKGQAIGQQRTAFAAGNVDVNSGTAAQVQEQTAYWSAADVAKIQNNAALKAWGYQTEANYSKYQGKLAKQKGYLNAAGTLLGGAADIYGFKKDQELAP